MAIKSTEMASSLKPRVCEKEGESQEETSDSQTNGRETLVGSIDGLSLDTYLPESVNVLKEELAAAKQHAAKLLEERAEKENILKGYQQAISQRDTIIQHVANELTSFDVKESVDDLEAIFQQSLAKIERERLEKRELEAVRERKDKDTEKQISELKEAIVLVEQRSEDSYTQMMMEVAKKLETGEWITAEDLVKERALIVELREELERKSSMVSQFENVLELEKRARVKEIEMFKNLLHNKEDEKVEVENKLHKLKKGVKEQLVQISEEKSATHSGTWREPQSPESVSKHTRLACGTLRAGREKSKTMQLIEKLEEQRENALSMLYKVKNLVLSAHAELGELRSQIQEMHMRLEEKSILSLRLGEEQKISEKEVEELQVRLGEEQKRSEKEVEELQVQLEMHKEELERAQLQLKTERASIEEWAEVADSLQAAIDITNERMSDVTNMLHVKEVEAVQLQKEVEDLKGALTKNQTTIRTSAKTLEIEQRRAAELERKLVETLKEKEDIIANTKERAEKLESHLRSSQIAAFREVKAAGFLREELTAERERMREKEELFAKCGQNWKSEKEKELGLLEKKVIELQTKLNDLAKELTWERKERLRIESELADSSKHLCGERDVLAKEVDEQRQKFMSLGSNMKLALSSGLEDALHLSICKAELKRKQEYESTLENRNRQLSEERDALVKRVAEEKQKVVSLKAHMGFTLSRGLEDALHLSMAETVLKKLQEKQLAECSQNWRSEKEKELHMLELKVVELQTKMNDQAKELTWERKERLRIESELAHRSKQLFEERDVLAKEVAEERQIFMSLESNMRLALSSGLEDALHLSICKAELNRKQNHESDLVNTIRQSGEERDALVKWVVEEKQKVLSIKAHMEFTLSRGLEDALRLSMAETELRRMQEDELRLNAELVEIKEKEKEQAEILRLRICELEDNLRQEKEVRKSELAQKNKQLCEEREIVAKEISRERQKVVSLGSHMRFALANGLEDALNLSITKAELARKRQNELKLIEELAVEVNEKEEACKKVTQVEEVVVVLRQRIDDLEGDLRHAKNMRDKVEGLLEERKQLLGQMVEDLQREVWKEKENARCLVQDLERILAKELDNSVRNAILERTVGAENERSQFLEKSIEDSRAALEEEKSLSRKLAQQAEIEKENGVHLTGLLDALYLQEGKLQEELKTAKNELQYFIDSKAKLERELANARNAVQALTIRQQETEIELEEKVRKTKDFHEGNFEVLQVQLNKLLHKSELQKKEVEAIQRREAELEAALFARELVLKKQDSDLEELKIVKEEFQQLNELKINLEAELVNEKETVLALAIRQQELEIEMENVRKSKSVLEDNVRDLDGQVTELLRKAEMLKEENMAFQGREIEFKSVLSGKESALKKHDDDRKEALERLNQGMEEVDRLMNEKEVMRKKVDELEGRLKELEWCETVANRNAEALLVKETEMEQKFKKAEEGNKRLEDELLAKEVEMGQRCSMLLQALEGEREKQESQNSPTIINDLKREVEMKEQEIRRYLQLLQEAEEQIAAMKEEVRQLRMSNAANERNDYQGGGLEEHIVRADEFRELKEVNNQLELELNDMVAQKEAEESARLSLEERATYAGQKCSKFEEEVKFLAERLNFAVNAKQETERQLIEKKELSTELRRELDEMIQWKQQNERTLMHLKERLELEQQVSLKNEEELKRLRFEIVKCKDEIVKYEDEIVKYNDDLVKCKDEMVTCRSETIKCKDEAAKWENEAKISKQKIVEVGSNMREAEESWNRKEEDGRRKTSELELMVKKLEEEVKLRQGEVTKKEEELEAMEREIAGCLEYLANWAKRVPVGSTDGKARINEGSTEVNKNIKANGDNGQQCPKNGANSLKVESEGEKRSEKGLELTARIQLQTLWEILKEIEKSLMGKLSALEKQCAKQRRQLQLFHSNYQKSEAEVELLHKDVETLDIILAETDMRLTSFSGVLKHFPGMPDFIAKVKAVAANRFLDGPRPMN